MATALGKPSSLGIYALIVLAVGAGMTLIVLESVPKESVEEGPTPEQQRLIALYQAQPRSFKDVNLQVWWDPIPNKIKKGLLCTGTPSNIHPGDYIGPKSCQSCHRQNYNSWRRHPHRWMNALADNTAVKGDFSGKASIKYLGGTADFFRDGEKYMMRLQRDGRKRIYQVNQTIGSRFFQYYVGKLVEGPEPYGHQAYKTDHVLGFGYWLEPQEWVPVVHVDTEKADGLRHDPFKPTKKSFFAYSKSCNFCHTTMPLSDKVMFFKELPFEFHWELTSYLKNTRPKFVSAKAHTAYYDKDEVQAIIMKIGELEAPKHAITLGISCEACHLGSKEHVKSNGKVLPKFFPSSPHLYVKGKKKLEFGRTHANLNWTCGRCHSGSRPRFAAGMSTWNSIEYTDAMLGSCYSKLTCIECHNPHRGIGKKWPHPPDQDDGLCLKCHDQFKDRTARREHTHHEPGSRGDRCMNCHMPRINEGLQDLVRTHMIYSPTRADMLEANHPNACNMCHTKEPIDWTLKHLDKWYGKKYDMAKIQENYPHRLQPAAIGWTKSDNQAVRLVGADALIREKNLKALPVLLNALDDSFIVNRQFTEWHLEKLINVRFRDFGYRFYMTPAERKSPLANIRAKLLGTKTAK